VCTREQSNGPQRETTVRETEQGREREQRADPNTSVVSPSPVVRVVIVAHPRLFHLVVAG